MKAMTRRLLTLPAALAVVAVSVVAAPVASRNVQPLTAALAATCPTPTAGSHSASCSATTSVTLTPGTGLQLADQGKVTYTSLKNIGGNTTVTCTYTPTNSGVVSSATYTIQFAGSSKSQVIYLMCLDSYTVSDLRGSGSGWHLTFQMTPWKCTTIGGSTGGCTANATMPAGSTYMDVPQVVCTKPTDNCQGQESPPTLKMTGSSPIDTTTAVMVASAAAAKGMGKYTFYPRTDTCGGTNTICQTSTGSTPTSATMGQLSLYAPNTTKNGYYVSTLTESLTSGP